LVRHSSIAPKHYFYGALLGYLAAIVATVIVMLVFNHGQPALLYLVPGCLLSVLINALLKNEFKELWDFNEEKILGLTKLGTKKED
jgi:minor histocompatibility antigen H13